MNDHVADIPADTSDDDLKAMGLPPRFTFDDLKGSFEDEEIAQMADDGLVELPDDFKRPAAKESAADTIARQNAPEGDDGDDDPDADDLSGKDDESAGAGDGDPEGDDAKKDGADAAANDDKPGAEDDQKGDDTDTGAQAQPDPVRDLKNAEDAQKVLDSFDDDLAALQDAYDDGEMTSQELREKTKELNSAQLKAQREVDEVERHNADQQKAYETAWYGKTDAFMANNPALADKTPIPGMNGVSGINVFDQALRHVTGTPAFADMTMDQKIAAAADIADSYVEQQTGKKLRVAAKPDPATENKGKQKDAGKTQDGPKQGKRPEPPTTLANVTAATDNEIEDGRFAAIDRATGLEAEDMLARMSDAEREAYLRGA